MIFQFTKRPLNICNACEFTWYPRGHDISLQCPNCKSKAVDLAPDPILALLSKLGDIFIAICLCLFWYPLCYPFLLLFRIVSLFRAWLIEVLSPVMAMVVQVAKMTAVKGKEWLIAGAGWSLSVFDDLKGESTHEVNAIGLIAKLIVIASACLLVIVLSINICNFVLRL